MRHNKNLFNHLGHFLLIEVLLSNTSILFESSTQRISLYNYMRTKTLKSSWAALFTKSSKDNTTINVLFFFAFYRISLFQQRDLVKKISLLCRAACWDHPVQLYSLCSSGWVSWFGWCLILLYRLVRDYDEAANFKGLQLLKTTRAH